MAANPHKWKFNPSADLKLRWPTPDMFAEEWGTYFDACYKAKLIPTFAGAAIWFACTQQTLKGYADRKDYQEVYQAAQEYLEAMVVDRLFQRGSPVGAIFYLCNRFGHRWSNRHQLEASQPAGGSGGTTSNSIIVVPYGSTVVPFKPAAESEVAPDPGNEDGESDA